MDPGDSWLNWVFQPQEVIGSDWHGCKASFTNYPNQSNIATNPSTSMNWSIRLEKPSSLNISEADVLSKLSLDLISLTLNCMATLGINTWVFNSLGGLGEASFVELPKETRQLFCEFLTDVDMKINCPCSEGEMWLAFWWLMEPCVFCRCPDSAAVLDQLTRPLWWRNHFCVSLVLQSPAFLAVAWALLLFLCRSLFHEWDESQFRPCAYFFFFFF